MADMYNNENSNTRSSSSRDRDRRPSDEMSFFLNQILRSSSSSPYMAHADPHTQLPIQRDNINRPCPPRDGISVVDLADGTNGAGGGSYFSGNMKGSSAANLSFSSIGGVSENETDECDAESEDGLEALVDEVPTKAAPPRRSSKRSRAAEVHNLSEKRRRSRINEKMKALQNLIPNSNKTDKASMLDEAIEYLKELQLQVQMLSMRNGISLYSASVSGLPQPIQLSRLGFDDENGSRHPSVAGLLSLNQETLPHATLGPRKPSSVSNQRGLPDMSNVINLETTFSLESSLRGHFGPFPLHASSQEIYRKDVLQHRRQNANHSERYPESGASASISLPFETKAPNMEDGSFLESGMIGRNQTGGLLMKDLERNVMPSQSSKG